MLKELRIAGFGGQVLLNRGIQLSPAGPATAMRYGDIVFALVFQSTLLGSTPAPLKLLGAGLICSCVVAVITKARRAAAEGGPRGEVASPAAPPVGDGSAATGVDDGGSGALAAASSPPASLRAFLRDNDEEAVPLVVVAPTCRAGDYEHAECVLPQDAIDDKERSPSSAPRTQTDSATAVAIAIDASRSRAGPELEVERLS